MSQVDVHHQQVGQTLVPFGLEVVLSHPHGVVAVVVHRRGDGLGLFEHGGQVVVVKQSVVYRRAAVADVGHINVAGEEAVELGNHG